MNETAYNNTTDTVKKASDKSEIIKNLFSLMQNRGPKEKVRGAFGGKRKHNHVRGFKRKSK